MAKKKSATKMKASPGKAVRKKTRRRPTGKKPAAKRKPSNPKRSGGRKKVAKKKAPPRIRKVSPSRKAASRQPIRRKKRAPAPSRTSLSSLDGREIEDRGADFDVMAPSDDRGLGPESGGQAGDTEGLSRSEIADSESVEELIEEGQAFEAGIISGVENAPDADEGEVTTREVPEDDVPREYLDEQ
ncbi:MAG: hypothetical protein ACRD16_01275 [Thermoanaerobaculia bacterium]